LSPQIDAIYCISLQEQPHRAAAAAAHFHTLGLCREVTFYRPVRGPRSDRAIWESHRAVAQDAIAKGHKRVLVLEDDIVFTPSRDKLGSRVAAALAALPKNWWCLYLGHVPIQAYFVRRNLMRVRSGCTCAYLANEPLLAWIAATEPASSDAPISRWLGQSLDNAMANLPGMYAMFPMVAVQRFLGDYRVDTRVDDAGRRRSLFDIDRYRYLFIFGPGARFAEAVSVVLSPFHWLTLERARRRVSHNDSRLTAFIKPDEVTRSA
jgi:hypothetical protein